MYDTVLGPTMFKIGKFQLLNIPYRYTIYSPLRARSRVRVSTMPVDISKYPDMDMDKGGTW